MAESLIVGLGNSLRRDDGVGYQAALDLEAQGFSAIAALQLLPEFALELARARKVLFLDADLSISPGIIRFRQLLPGASSATATHELYSCTDSPDPGSMPQEAEPLTHNLGVEGLLNLTQTLTGRSPKAYALSLGVADIGHGEGFSPQVLAAYGEYLKVALAFLEHHARTEPRSEPVGPR